MFHFHTLFSYIINHASEWAFIYYNKKIKLKISLYLCCLISSEVICILNNYYLDVLELPNNLNIANVITLAVGASKQWLFIYSYAFSHNLSWHWDDNFISLIMAINIVNIDYQITKIQKQPTNKKKLVINLR